MRRVLVFGAGRSGRAAEALLQAQGFGVVVLDGEDSFPGDDRNERSSAASCWGQAAAATGMSPPRAGAAEVAAAEAGAATFLSPQEDRFDFAVVSPGIALTHKWTVEAKRRGIPLKSELQLGCEELRRRGWKLLAVTGSKGKSSVVKVVADALNLAGRRAVACGNYGLPVCEVAGGCGDRNVAAPGWAVVEVSSFMMETTELSSDAFEAATVLNLQEDHLDRHGSVEVYHGLKRKLLSFAKRGFGPAATGMSPPRAGAAEAAASTGMSPSLWKGSYFDNEILSGNAAAAAGLMRVAGLDDAAIARAFAAFEPLPHRMNRVATIGGVDYVDDSKATSIAALAAGVKMAVPPVRLIAGGLPKGDDPKNALPILTERVKKVYLIGQSAETFSAAWKSAVDCEICGTMEIAVEAAKREAAKGETVLLSPGTASFDQFQSFGERGEVFARLVKKEREDK